MGERCGRIEVCWRAPAGQKTEHRYRQDAFRRLTRLRKRVASCSIRLFWIAADTVTARVAPAVSRMLSVRIGPTASIQDARCRAADSVRTPHMSTRAINTFSQAPVTTFA